MRTRKWSRPSGTVWSGQEDTVPAGWNGRRRISACARSSGIKSPIPIIRATATACSTTRIENRISKIQEKQLTNFTGYAIIFERWERRKYGRVVELVDSLDSGSSVHCGRAGSSPASPTKRWSDISSEISDFSCFLTYFANKRFCAWGKMCCPFDFPYGINRTASCFFIRLASA